MQSSYTRWLMPLSAVCTLLLAGCGGVGSTSGSPTASSYQLSVTAPPAGAGTITSSPAGISCPGACSASFAAGTKVTLTATPGTNYFFGGWKGSCSGTGTCTLTINAAASVSAAFSAGEGVSVAMAGTGSGTVTSSPAGINCPTTCSASFPQNSQITLTETPGANNTFAGWSGACTGTAACSLTVTSGTNVTATFNGSVGVTGSLQSLNHIIIFAQENRSLDHYFGYMEQYWAQHGFGTNGQTFDGLPQFNPTPGAIPTVPGCDPSNPNGPDVCTPDPSVQVPSFHMASICTEELSPFWNEAHTDWNVNDPTSATPALDGFVVAGANDARQYPLSSNGGNPVNDTNGYRTMGYFTDADLPFYYYMASTFATSDRWFAPMMSRTQLNRMFMMAATSGGHAYPLAPPYGPLANETIFQALQNAGISWKIYVNSKDTNGCTDAYTDANSQCLIQYSYINMFTYYSTIYNSGGTANDLLPHIASVAQFEKDAAAGQLPQVALIEPASDAGLDEHPTDDDATGGVNIQAGAQYAEGVIEALMYSPSWKDSAIIFTYDEPGGFYDHVPPQVATPPDTNPADQSPIDLKVNDACDGLSPEPAICTFGYTGYRVPMILISPFAKKNYVSHTVYDHTAILHLIEERFGIPALTNRDAAQADMSANDFFDFVNVPWATPPPQSSVPQQLTNEPCSLAAPVP